MAKSHIKYTMWHICRKEIDTKKYNDARLKPILHDVLRIAALYELTENSGPIFDTGFFGPGT